MGSAWTIVVNYVLPPPLVLSILCLLPLPKQARRYVGKFIDKFLSFPVVGGAQLVHLMIFISGLAFASCIRDTWEQQQVMRNKDMLPLEHTTALGKKWRLERNFWIACMAFMLWCMLYRLYQLSVVSIHLEDKVDDYEVRLGIKVKAAPKQTKGALAGGKPQPAPDVDPKEALKLAQLEEKLAQDQASMGLPEPSAPLKTAVEKKAE